MITLKMLVQIVVNVAVYGVLLFLPAWTFDWPRAWVLLALIFTGMLVTRLWALHDKHALLDQRRQAPIQPGQPLADRLVVVLFLTIFPAYIAFIPVDVFRLHLLARPADAVAALGLGLAVGGWLMITLAFRENAFAASIVKPQEDRFQCVVDTGVYGVVRHPLYLGVVLVLVGIALWLRSYAAAIASVAPIAVLVIRILVEESFLRQRLRGYDAYAKKVGRRLIPLIW